MDGTIHSEERHGCTITIMPDADPPNPRDDDNLGTMVCWHRCYRLGDKQPRDPQPVRCRGRWGRRSYPRVHTHTGAGPYSRLNARKFIVSRVHTHTTRYY